MVNYGDPVGGCDAYAKISNVAKYLFSHIDLCKMKYMFLKLMSHFTCYKYPNPQEIVKRVDVMMGY